MPKVPIEVDRAKLREQCRVMVENGTNVTLDGRPAKIVGFARDFGIVCEINDPIRSAEWSWHSIHSILSKGGAFTS